MKRAWIMPVALAIGLTASLGSARVDPNAKRLMQQAEIKEKVERNVPAAIQLYDKAAAAAGNDRSLKAKAHLRLGVLYKGRDQKKARENLERAVVLGDPADADEAKRLLRSFNTPTPPRNAGNSDGSKLIDKLIWEDEKTETSGRVSFDGRYISFVDRSQGGALAIKELSTGRVRVLKPAEGGIVGSSAISRSGGEVAYSWRSSVDGTIELRVVGTDGLGGRWVYGGPNIVDLQPMDWTPDGRILFRVRTRDRAYQIAVVDTNGDRFRNLNTFVFPQEPRNLAVSPDGRYVGYDAPAPQGCCQPYRQRYGHDPSSFHHILQRRQ